MTLSDYKQADISSDGTVVKYSYPEDKLKASLKELKESLANKMRIELAESIDLVEPFKEIFGAELNG